MRNKTLYFLMLIFGFTTVISCSSDDDNGSSTKNLTLNLTGLEDLGSGYVYESWLILESGPVSVGTFSVNASGVLSKTSFSVNANTLSNALAYVLTIEPNSDPNTAPSSVHILAGDFTNNATSATVSTNHQSALGTDFTGATGKYFLASPTDGTDNTNEKSGVWWVQFPTPMMPAPGLTLPALPATGWKYEGWAVIGTTPVSTGKFTSVTGADDFSGFSGSAPAPSVPGEDFLMAAPAGLTFPTDLSGQKVVISVEPDPDNSPNPFLLKPLVAMIPATAKEQTSLSMGNNAAASNPGGSVTR
tara:strand:- start:264 stop:1169 length:906 start_codon:yes stop_codon:yes gene_type:complete